MNTCGNRAKLPSLYASWKSHALLGRLSELFGQASYPLQCNRCRNFRCWAQCQHFPVVAEYAWMYCWMYRGKTHSKFLMHEVVPLQVERWMEDRFVYSTEWEGVLEIHLPYDFVLCGWYLESKSFFQRETHCLGVWFFQPKAPEQKKKKISVKNSAAHRSRVITFPSISIHFPSDSGCDLTRRNRHVRPS